MSLLFVLFLDTFPSNIILFKRFSMSSSQGGRLYLFKAKEGQKDEDIKTTLVVFFFFFFFKLNTGC